MIITLKIFTLPLPATYMRLLFKLFVVILEQDRESYFDASIE